MNISTWVKGKGLALGLSVGVTAGFAASASAVTVWLDYGTDWETAVNQTATSAGVTAFSPLELDALETAIAGELDRIYNGYDLTFLNQATDPGGSREVIDFAAPLGTNVLGQAPLSPYNIFTDLTVSVDASNFGFILDEFSGSTNRAVQLDQLGTAIAGTASHELLHSFGARHSAAYGTEGITNANYSNTGGLQNQHIIATGSTGLNETQRESQRTLNTWERALLDVAGRTGAGGATLTLSDTNNFSLAEVNDIGNNAGTATNLDGLFLTGATSGLELTVLQGDLDALDDQEWLSFTVNGPTLVTAEAWSLDLFVEEFDGQFQIFDTDGTTLIAANGDNEYSGNLFGSGGNGTEDPFLVNVALPQAGLYFLALTLEDAATADLGDDFLLTIGLQAVPEPTTAGVLLLGSALAFSRRRRRSE